ncbi:hypothetical protein [Hyphomicrobium sp. ghe19]|uniref:hypothetical protein n=1 Tax=Hyphomicrobium sp. ghe19 TaxID=2682968 RepID=UPI00136784D5|nr:4-amino-4-deoxy-L-arabinose-phosphoundecaprenol flippase subunit ArnF [Hyphomicrobium sp. ghe19]
MFNRDYILISGAVLVIAVGQIIFKYAAQQLHIDEGRTLVRIALDNLFPIILVALALGLYVLSTIAWIQALRTTPLSVAYIFNAMAFLIVPLAGVVFFGEPLPKFFFIGALMIIGGIVVVTIK